MAALGAPDQLRADSLVMVSYLPQTQHLRGAREAQLPILAHRLHGRREIRAAKSLGVTTLLAKFLRLGWVDRFSRRELLYLEVGRLVAVRCQFPMGP